jgi:replication initiation and membrane attachment protein DnaB
MTLKKEVGKDIVLKKKLNIKVMLKLEDILEKYQIKLIQILDLLLKHLDVKL